MAAATKGVLTRKGVTRRSLSIGVTDTTNLPTEETETNKLHANEHNHRITHCMHRGRTYTNTSSSRTKAKASAASRTGLAELEGSVQAGFWPPFHQDRSTVHVHGPNNNVTRMQLRVSGHQEANERSPRTHTEAG